MTRICSQCKRVLEKGWKACPYCGGMVSEDGRVFPPICPHCKRVFKSEWKICPYCGSNPAEPSSVRYDYVVHPSRAWYLVPFFFGIVGGLIGYVGVKDEDKGMAVNLLLVGILMFFLDIVALWVLFS